MIGSAACYANTWSKHLLTHARFNVRCMWVSLCFQALLSLIRTGAVLLVLPVCVRLLWRSVPRGVGVLRSCLPTSLFEHLSMGLQSALSCPLWPLHHRMCVIAERLGHLRWLSHAAGRGHFFGASTSWRTSSRRSDCSTQKSGFKKNGDNLPSVIVVLGVPWNVCFTPRWALAGLA